MRILVISNYYPPLEMGGWPQLTRDIVDRLIELDHKVMVLTSRHQKERIMTPEQGVQRVLHLQSPDREHYHARYVLTDRWKERQNENYLNNSVAGFLPDVIFIHGLWNMSRKVALDAEVLFPNKVVYYIASTWPIEMDAHTSYWTRPQKRIWLRVPKKVIGVLVRKTMLSITASQSLRFNRVLCVSKFIQDCLVHQLGVPIQNTRVVHNGIDVNVFSPQPRKRMDENKLALLYAGGFWEHKGIMTAIEAVGQLVNNMGVRDIHLTLVGAGHPGYVRKMKGLINRLGIDQFISFEDRVSREHMPALLNSYNVLLFPSTGPEALPRIVQEAMACGLMVIGSTAGGTPEILNDGKNGLAFEPGNSLMLADKISMAVSNPELRDRLAMAARNTVEQHYTVEGMVDHIEDYFASL